MKKKGAGKKLRIFHGAGTGQERERHHSCLETIRDKISEISGVTGFHEQEEWTAFAGSMEDPALVLTLSVAKSGGKNYLYADLDDEFSWQEWDFADQAEFEDAVVRFIAPLVNRTVKTVIETRKHRFVKFSRYYLSSDGVWSLIDEEMEDGPLVRALSFKDSVEENISEYHLK